MTVITGRIPLRTLVVGFACMLFPAILSLVVPAPALAAVAPGGSQQLYSSAIAQQSGTLQAASAGAANARGSLVDLYMNGDYSSYDITGDGKPDTIKIRPLGLLSLGSSSPAYEGLVILPVLDSGKGPGSPFGMDYRL